MEEVKEEEMAGAAEEAEAGYEHANTATAALLQQYPQSPQIYLAEDLHRVEKTEKEAELRTVGSGDPTKVLKVVTPAGEPEEELRPLIIAEEEKERNPPALEPGSQVDSGVESAGRVKEDWLTNRKNFWDDEEIAFLEDFLNQPRGAGEEIGGRICHHAEVWQRTCGGEQFVRIGMLPYWKDDAAPDRLAKRKAIREYRFTETEEKALQKQLESDIREKIIIKVRAEQLKFASPIFMVPKPDNKWRMVVDNRLVNAEQLYIHCRMDGPLTVQEVALQGDWATSIDLKSAFSHMRVNESFMPYLGFAHRGEYYMYRAMPFGCRHSPRVFMEALSYPLNYIRAHWKVRIVVYMDDFLMLHQDREYLRLATLQIATYLSCLGWTLSLEKCEFTPVKAIKFLGWRWCFDTLTLQMTPEMRKYLLWQVGKWIRKAMRAERVACRRLGSLIGSLNFLRSQIPRASLYLHTMHSELTRAVNSSGWNGFVTLGTRIISELQFWRRNIYYNTPFAFRKRAPQATLTTDAAEPGWGAELEIGSQSLITFGSYSKSEGLCSSNLRETRGVLRSLLYFADLIRERQIRSMLIRSDNMVTVYNLRRQGVSINLLNETRQIFSLLQKLDVRIVATHVPGIQNTLADALSRMDLVGDYQLKPDVYRRALNRLNLSPTIDVFANSSNNKCRRFLALPGPLAVGALALDALCYSWTGEVPYVFPPVQIIPRVLQKLRQEVRAAILVVPEWTSRPWWNLMQENATASIRLGRSEDVLKAGPSLAIENRKLPPGFFLMVRMSYV